MSLPAEIPVVAAVLTDTTGRVLVARRAPDAHQGGLWEFPGGKRHEGETPEAALARELREELDIEPRHARRLIRVVHAYADRAVELDVWWVSAWKGRIRAVEGQPLRWVDLGALRDLPMPEADRPVLTALRLPERLLVTPEPGERDRFIRSLRASLEASPGAVVQFRVQSLRGEAWQALARRALSACRAAGSPLLLNADPDSALALGADGVHLNGTRLAACASRPVPMGLWCSASVHDEAQLEQARRAGVDFVLVGPVAETRTHPGRPGIGWARFEALARAAGRPAFALGGLTPADLDAAFARGAQGVAAIRGLWKDVG